MLEIIELFLETGRFLISLFMLNLASSCPKLPPSLPDIIPSRASGLPEHLRPDLERAAVAWLERLEPHTARSYRRGLVHFAQWLEEREVLELPNPPKIRHPDRLAWEDDVIACAGQYLLGRDVTSATFLVEIFLQDLVHPKDGPPPFTRATAQSRLAALRWALREARRAGQIDWRLEVSLPKAQKDEDGRLVVKRGRDMRGPSIEEARRLIATAKTDADPRAWFVMSFLRTEGFREHEVRQVNVEDLELRRRPFLWSVRKKREGPARYPISKNTHRALLAWLEARGDGLGPLLTGGEHGRNHARRIGKTTIWTMVRRLADAAGVPNMSPHRIRHRACTDIVRRAMKEGLPEEEILFLTGHSSRAALQPYYEAAKSRKSARRVLDSLEDLPDDEEIDD